MEAVTLSPKYQIVIPQAVREKLQLKAGQKFQVLTYDGRIELVPVMFAQFLHPRVQASEDTLVRGQHQRIGRTQVKPVE